MSIFSLLRLWYPPPHSDWPWKLRKFLHGKSSSKRLFGVYVRGMMGDANLWLLNIWKTWDSWGRSLRYCPNVTTCYNMLQQAATLPQRQGDMPWIVVLYHIYIYTWLYHLYLYLIMSISISISISIYFYIYLYVYLYQYLCLYNSICIYYLWKNEKINKSSGFAA